MHPAMRVASAVAAVSLLSRTAPPCHAFAPPPSRRGPRAAPSSLASSVVVEDVQVAADAPPFPVSHESTDVDADVAAFSYDEPPKLGAIARMLPADTWKVDTRTSLAYFAADVLAVACSMGFLNAVVTSEGYHAAPVWGQVLMAAPLQILTGFAMWCTWCIGHDAGALYVAAARPAPSSLSGSCYPSSGIFLMFDLNKDRLKKEYSIKEQLKSSL